MNAMERPGNRTLLCPEIIGRTPEFAALRSLAEQASGKKGHIALIAGEAGIGKSRLVAEVKTYAASHGFLLLQGSCFPTDHAIPYAPLLDLLRAFLTSHSSGQTAEEVKQVAQAFFPLLSDVGHLIQDVPPGSRPVQLDPEQEKRHRFEVLTRLLISQAEKHSLLLIMEDLHCSDDISLEFLHYLTRRCSAHPFLLLLTYRSDEIHQSLRHFLAKL